MESRIVWEKIDVANVISNFLNECDEFVGGVLVFIGLARRSGKEGDNVKSVIIDVDADANLKIKRWVSDIRRKYGLRNTAIIHRAGEIKVGEAIAVIAASAERRANLFDAIREAIDRYKNDESIRLREVYE